MCAVVGRIKKVKLSRYRSGVAQGMGRGIALLFHDRSTRTWRVVSSTPRPHFTPWKDPVHILQEVGWAPGPGLADGKSHSHRDSIPDRPARSQSLCRLSYPNHSWTNKGLNTINMQGATTKKAREELNRFTTNCGHCYVFFPLIRKI